ncbi:MAG TPA: AmmeMemoRadiSam system radical SAM enzyme [Caldisericia bacterium]|nr:AmmeMemoRadiSam system radical SAM enzyme [Caldisericia bacterium]HOL82435.1 AmmeMemoRadiSam system radical SAM enzyme [Caldisericia bacterium]HPC57015.1 AmmeMemoRadiSam system radical SAM enzyme [Caldisericia bacterium]HPP43182.1 AmmeMemoRadiSam system radical SAM enzyme [Caldisericia bacterium]HRT37395.1 AmmeMemoRadiSam system radical SAM enzyme [Caldisericia bacterium]
MDNIREALLYEKIEKNRVRCNLCFKKCIIKENEHGFCGVRKNIDGKLYTEIYGLASSVAMDPIEKKPLFHFFPGSKVLSLGTWGCNLRCAHCQNWEISYEKYSDKIIDNSNFLSPESLIDLAKKYNSKGIAFTYNEPTIWFEYTLDVFKIAKSIGLYTVYVTNGTITSEGLHMISPYLDAFRVDIKAFYENSFKKITGVKNINSILERTIEAKRIGMHIEVVTNVIPTVNDSRKEMDELSKWIFENLGLKTPWHVTRFYPYQQFSYIEPTPIKTLEIIRDIGESNGLKFIYVGNVFGHPYENTYCPNCKSLVIKREGYNIKEYNIINRRCKFCGEDLNIVD